MASRSYIFGGETGETPQSIAQKRALIDQIMGNSRAPRSFGEGLSAIGDGIVANVTRGRADDGEAKGRSSADDTFSKLVASLTGQGAPNPSVAPQTASDATAALAGGGGDFMSGLINSESGGNWNALNDEGYGGRLQFGDARLADAARAGIIPAGVTGAQFSQMSPEQQQAVEAWHFADIDKQAQGMGLDRYYGQTIAGVPITPESVKAMAHLGGIGGVQKFVTSGGQYNPADSNGTRLSDYGSRFGGGGQQAAPAPVQVASLDPSIGAPASQPAQLPPLAPPQAAQAAPMAAPVPQQAPSAPIQTAQGPSLQMLMEAAANPFLMANPGMAATVNSMIEQEMQKQDPRYQQQVRAGDLGIQKSEIELENLRNPKPDPGFRVLTPEEASSLNLPQGAFQVGPDNKVYEIGGGGTNVNVNMGDGAPGLGKLSTDFGYVSDPDSRLPVIDPATGLPTAAPIPGSPAALAAQAAADAQAAGQDVTGRTANIVREDIGRIKDIVAEAPWYNPAVGFGSGVAKALEGSNATNVAALSKTVLANIGFDRLQQMREASPTGGALGAISDRELGTLQSVMGNLEQSQSVDQFIYNLDRLGEVYDEISKKAAAYPGAKGFGFTSDPGQSQANPGVVDFSDYFK